MTSVRPDWVERIRSELGYEAATVEFRNPDRPTLSDARVWHVAGGICVQVEGGICFYTMGMIASVTPK